ncbi:MAG: DMT family transporter [Burkholderiales bacterium]|nr:DMT family transporter [Burkholderiales bacterium]
MTLRDALAMLVLAALWGASFLFLRVASPVLGAVGVAAWRVGVAALLLLPLLAFRGDLPRLKPLLPALFVSGLLSYALPFVGISQAARSLPAGLLSILNASTPLWGALVGWLWASERLSPSRLLGLAVGFTGVALLAADRSQINTATAWQAAVLCLASTLMYALAVHHAKRYLNALSPMSLTTGSLAAAAVMLALPAWWLGPQATHGPTLGWADTPTQVWGAVACLAVLCTALGYLMFYRLISRVGPTRALTVTFLIPVFGMLWGSLFLDERVTHTMMASTAVIFLGTLLSSGAWSPLSPLQEQNR